MLLFMLAYIVFCLFEFRIRICKAAYPFITHLIFHEERGEGSEAEGDREQALIGILPCLAVGEGSWAMICTQMEPCEGGPYRLLWQELLSCATVI